MLDSFIVLANSTALSNALSLIAEPSYGTRIVLNTKVYCYYIQIINKNVMYIHLTMRDRRFSMIFCFKPTLLY